jgi:hypothetical protein
MSQHCSIENALRKITLKIQKVKYELHKYIKTESPKTGVKDPSLRPTLPFTSFQILACTDLLLSNFTSPPVECPEARGQIKEIHKVPHASGT